jgi:hypothetical protein
MKLFPKQVDNIYVLVTVLRLFQIINSVAMGSDVILLVNLDSVCLPIGESIVAGDGSLFHPPEAPATSTPAKERAARQLVCDVCGKDTTQTGLRHHQALGHEVPPEVSLA